jgi:hypothetical protein
MGRLIAAVTIKRVLLSWIAAYLVSYGLLRLFADSNESHAINAIWGVAAFVFVGLVVALINVFGWWLYLWIAQGEDFDQILLHDLRSKRLIPPRRGDPRTFDYLAKLADDPTADPNERVKAATIFGGYSALVSKAGLFGGLAWRKAMDRAVLRYSQEHPNDG